MKWHHEWLVAFAVIAVTIAIGYAFVFFRTGYVPQ